MSIRPSSQADERTRPIKDGREGEGTGLSLASSRLEEPFLDFLPPPPEEGARGQEAVTERERERMDETVKPLCVESVSPVLLPPPPPPLSVRCRRILTNKITRRQGGSSLPLLLLRLCRFLVPYVPRSRLFSFPSIRYSKRPTVTDTTAMIHPGLSSRRLSSRLRGISPSSFPPARFFMPVPVERSHALPVRSID